MLVNEYEGRLKMYLADLYRLEDPQEVADLALEENAADGVLVVEWPDRAWEEMPRERLLVRLEWVDERSRELSLEPQGARDRELVEELLRVSGAEAAVSVELSIDTASDWAWVAAQPRRTAARRGDLALLSRALHAAPADGGRPAVAAARRQERADGGVRLHRPRELRRPARRREHGQGAGLRARDAPIVGVGRLEIEAYQYAACGRPVCALHRAGRGEVAWAVYQGPKAGWREIVAPRMSPPQEMMAEAPAQALFCGEEDDSAGRDARRSWRFGRAFAPPGRHLAELGWRRLAAGQADDARTLAPLYLREPAIGPQKPGSKTNHEICC